MARTVLVVRLDSMGDVLAAALAVRAVAASADRVVMLAGPLGAAAARMLVGVHDVKVFDSPWVAKPASPFDPAKFAAVIAELRAVDADEALILTSFHQSALPTALLLRQAGVPLISASSVDYPGSLLDRRLPEPGELPEPLRMLEIARGAGFELPAGDDLGLAVRSPLPAADPSWQLDEPYLVVHPGTSAPARAYPVDLWGRTVQQLTGAGWRVVLTGSDRERPLSAAIAGACQARDRLIDLAGRLELDQLAGVLSRAQAVVVANTGPAHLAAAVRTPVVSLFSPVVSARRWVPYGVPVVVLGDQQASCRGSRNILCPVEGHPCLRSVDPSQIVRAVATLSRNSVPA